MYGQCSIAMCWFPEGIYQKLNIELWVTWSNLAIPEWEPPCRVVIVMTPVIPSNAWPYISIIYHLGKPLYDGVPLYLHWWLSAGVYFPVLHNSFPVSIHILLIHIPFSHTSTHTHMIFRGDVMSLSINRHISGTWPQVFSSWSSSRCWSSTSFKTAAPNNRRCGHGSGSGGRRAGEGSAWGCSFGF